MPRAREAYGVGNPLQKLNPPVILSLRAPTSSDTNYEEGTIWIDRTGRTSYTLIGSVGGAVAWTAAYVGADLSVTGSITAGTSVAATTTVTAGTGITATTGGVTATAGNLTATNGNLSLGTAGNKLSIATGANASVGTATLTAGTVTVATTAVTANSLIMVWRQSTGATGAAAVGLISVGTITAGTSFVINSVDPSNSTAVIGTDVSVVGYMIIN